MESRRSRHLQPSRWPLRRTYPWSLPLVGVRDHVGSRGSHLLIAKRFGNYLRLDSIPRYGDGWAPVLKALRDGAFFISTGEVLLPRFTVGGKASGETLKINAFGKAKLEAGLTWTFPMAFAEVITGDGKEVHRKRIDLSGTGPFGKRALSETLDLTGKTWVRIEAWDVAANGVISQPIWLK